MELNDTVKVTLTKEGAEWLRGQKGDNKEGDIIMALIYDSTPQG